MNAVSRDWRVGDVIGTVVRALDAPSTAGLTYYVLHVFAGSELIVRDRLKRLARIAGQPIDVYCPLQSVTLPAKVRRGKKLDRKVIKRPAFAGYLFVGLETFHLLPRIIDLPSVVDFIRSFGCPVKVRSSIIDIIRDVETSGNLDLGLPVLRIQVGDSVLISDGVFRSFPATVIEMPVKEIPVDEADLHMVTVDIHIFGRSTRMELPVSHIEAT